MFLNGFMDFHDVSEEMSFAAAFAVEYPMEKQ
jgi:hypothetical protein